MNLADLFIAKKLAGGGGGGTGTDNYNDLSNKPQINSTALTGDKSASDLGLQSEIDSDNKISADYVDDTSASNKFVSAAEKLEWSGKQDAIDADHKIDADYVDDTTSDNKFVTASDKTAWNAKQNAIDSSHKLSSDLVDDTGHTNLFVTSTEKSTWNGKQDKIDSSHKLSSTLVSFDSSEAAALASGIDSSKVEQISTNQTNILYAIDNGVKNLFDPNSVDEFVNMEKGVNGYTYQSTQTDSRTNFRVVLLAYNGSTLVRTLYEANVYNTGIVTATFRKTSEFNRLAIGHSGSAKDLKIGFNVSNLENDKDYIFAINVTAANASVSIAWTDTMICTAEIYAQSPEFDEYALPNSSLTALSIYNNANGVKNLFEVRKPNYITPNSTVTINGTSITIACTNSTYRRASYKISLSAGTYVFSCNVTAKSSVPCAVRGSSVYDGTGTIIISDQTIPSTGNFNFEFTLASDTTFYLVFYVNMSDTAQTASITVEDVMVCAKSVHSVDTIYEPYAIPNSLLTSASAVNTKNGVKNLWDFANATVSRDYNITYTKTSTNIFLDNLSSSNGYSFVAFPIYLNVGNYAMQFNVTAATVYHSAIISLAQNDNGDNAVQTISFKGKGIHNAVFSITTAGTYYIIMSPCWEEATGDTSSITVSECMICDASVFATDSSYQPYALTNTDLTQAVNVLQKNAPVFLTAVSLNDLTENKLYYADATVTDKPVSGWGFVRNTSFDSNTGMQEFVSVGTSFDAYIRIKTSGTWQAWKQTTNT